MSVKPSIALCSIEKNDYQTITEHIQKEFHEAELTIIDFDSLNSFASGTDAPLIILQCHEQKVEFIQKHLEKVISNQPEALIILLLPADRSDLISLAHLLQVFFFLYTPIDSQELAIAFNRAHSQIRHNSSLRKHHTAAHGEDDFIGGCEKMQHLFRLIDRVAQDDYSTVLIRGESGTGKELVARALHNQSNRRKNNFVPVNCAAIPDELLESELFGHTKGSFTGADQAKQGRIQYADGGTLFLDEIGDMKPALQAKLLRVLQEKEFEPVGSLKPIPVDARILAATHCNLEHQVRQGVFREDLYYRLSVIPLEVPPLRERLDDIPLLLTKFIDTHTTKRGRGKIVFTPAAISILKQHEWRGNVRELENLVQHMSILYGGKHIYPHNLPGKYSSNSATINGALQTAAPKQRSIFDHSPERAALTAPAAAPGTAIDFGDGPIDFNQLTNDFENELIIKAMHITSGNKKETARLLKLKRTTLIEKIKAKKLQGAWPG